MADSGPKLLLDPYGDWAAAEGVPVVEDFGIDLLAVEARPWPRLGVDGAIVHLKGRGDFVAVFLLDLAAGAATTRQQHVFEEVIYVLSGHGSTTIEAADGRSHHFEWGPRSLFALPLNAPYRHFNGSGRERARLASTTSLPVMLNLFHDPAFVFANPYRFRSRESLATGFSGDGEFIPVRPGRHMWETNFIPDLAAFELKAWDQRGAGSSNMKFILAEGTMHAHSSEMAVGTYKKAHRHGPDFHVYAVTGHGYSLLWYERDQDFVRVDWRHGVVFAPPDMMYHQHFNTSPEPARYLAVALGSLRYPFTAEKRALFTGVDVSVRDGGRQIEYQDQDPRIDALYRAELAKSGVRSRMDALQGGHRGTGLMHELEFQHLHVPPEQREHLARVIWSADNVELETVGIDIGSSTSHLMFAHVHLQRPATGLSSRFAVVGREIRWRSPIRLTPYLADGAIDAETLGRFIDGCYRQAGCERAEVDSGAVILTGEALKRRNARAIADLFAAEGGKFVCAAAGHHLEAAMAAHGSGAVALSRQRHCALLNVDIGGGTTKFALVADGEVQATAAIAVGSRLVVTDADGRIVRLDGPARRLADALGIPLALGGELARPDRRRLARGMGRLIVDLAAGKPPTGIAAALMVTEPLAGAAAAAAVTFSGGVSEYLFGRETQRFGDLGPALAHQLQHLLAEGALAQAVWDPGQGIRATVIGASQFQAQVSGSTILVTDPKILPLRNLPVVTCAFDAKEPAAVAAALRRAMARADLTDGGGPVAIAFAWTGEPSHARLHAVAAGIAMALPTTIGRWPLVLLADGDVALTLGRIMTCEVAPGAALVSLDGVQLRPFDHVDIGEPLPPANVVTVIIKSLLF